MRLEDTETFAILLQNEFNNEKTIYDIVSKISLRQHVGYNVATINNERAYVIYNVDRKYLFNMATNKKLKVILRDKEEFYIIDFSNNTKGDIISHLTFTKTNGDKIEGAIMYENLKPELASAGKVIAGITLKGKNGITVRFPTLNDVKPYTVENFCIYHKRMQL